jgi:hypothetical protein
LNQGAASLLLSYLRNYATVAIVAMRRGTAREGKRHP